MLPRGKIPSSEINVTEETLLEAGVHLILLKILNSNQENASTNRGWKLNDHLDPVTDRFLRKAWLSCKASFVTWPVEKKKTNKEKKERTKRKEIDRTQEKNTQKYLC